MKRRDIKPGVRVQQIIRMGSKRIGVGRVGTIQQVGESMARVVWDRHNDPGVAGHDYNWMRLRDIQAAQ